MDITITGTNEFARLAAQIRAEGGKDLGPEMGRGLRKASEPVQRAIRAEYRTLPASGGYSAAFSKSLRFRTSLRAGGRRASFTLTTFADGTKERRDIEALEGGRLRHPVWGRSRGGRRKGERITNPWAMTTVRGSFHKRGTDGAADEAERELGKVLDDLARRLIN